jgi:class 3 adenylate cyclase/tetratricopeptide (TPR) repeat protein
VSIICPQCQTQNRDQALFCDECGARLETACPNCGEANRRTAKFCTNCGQTIGGATPSRAITAPATVSAETHVPRHLAEKILATRHLLEGERKHVTVLFADIRGSTALVEGRDPEEAQMIIDPVLHLMMKAVHRYEGTVNQILGDGIMALFGAPLAHEDHALRACYAALAMQEELYRHRVKLGQSEDAGLQIGIGLNTGEVVVRSIDNDLNVEYSALGHTTHLAARMQELASGGAILMTHSTLREVEGFVQVKARGAVQAKGISRPVDAFELVGATTARTRVQAASVRGLTPLVGRDSEVGIFNRLVEQTGAGRGHILAMVGEPGMGKSRLVHEFARHQLPPGWLVLEAESVSYGKATPYFPLIEMLRRYFQIGDEETVDNIPELVAVHVSELDNTLRDAIAPVLSLLSVLPDDNQPADEDRQTWLSQQPDIARSIQRFNALGPQQRRRHTLDALKRLLIRESQRQPVLAVFEDLHWIDNETLSFLDGLIESLPMARLLLLVNYRPGFGHSWGDKTYYTQLQVGPLQQSSAEEFLRHLLGRSKDLDPLKEMLSARTEGNPFFAEESVRSLVEAGFLVGEKGAYRPGLKVDSIHVPSTVQNVVADRIDRLPVEEKHLLQTAAVIGVAVPYPLLLSVTDLSEDTLKLYMGHLQAAEFLYESNLFPELEYTFKHALINEIAYGSLLHERRTWLHSKVMTALEKTQGAASHDHVEKLAHHAFHGELWEKAVDYMGQAADKAVARSANREAADSYNKALAALQHLPQDDDRLRRAVDIRLELRNPLFLLGQFDDLHRNLREAESIAEGTGDHKRLGRVLNFLIGYYDVVGDHSRAIESGVRGLQFNKGDLELNTVTHYYMGVTYHHMGRYQQSIATMNQALYAVNDERYKYERFGTANVIAVICRSWMTQSLAQLGEFKEGVSVAEAGIQIAEASKHAYSLAYARCSLGILFLLKGDIEHAIGELERSRSICESSGLRVLMTHVGSNLGYAYALTGRLNDAIPLMETAEAQSELIGRRAAWSLRLTWFGQACFLAGQMDAARDHGERALALATSAGERGYQAWALKLLGDIAQKQSPDLAPAHSYYEQGMTLATQLEMRPLRAHLHLSCGRLYRRAQKNTQAERAISLAREHYRSMEMPFWVAAADRELDTLIR